jgi:hypothetical protein
MVALKDRRRRQICEGAAPASGLDRLWLACQRPFLLLKLFKERRAPLKGASHESD